MHPPGADTPWDHAYPTPWDHAPPWGQTPPGADAPYGQIRTRKHVVLPQTSFAGGKNSNINWEALLGALLMLINTNILSGNFS